MAEPAPLGERRALRVSELTRYLKFLVERDELLTAISVQGEVSSLSRSPGGHLYLTLKDTSSQLACVLFRREAAHQAEVLRELHAGMDVIVHGHVAVYEPRGSFQVYVERIVPQGQGVLHRQFQRLRDRLEGEGLFAPERKRPLPPFPSQLALITSPRSQAYHDVLHRLRTQYPFVRVIEVGVSVQGDGASDEMAMAIDIVNRLTSAELILLVRGGGAPEELAAFNDERLARAIFASRIPVVTGIGHETDQTIADMVADQRAATPSLAAAVSVPDVRGLVDRVASLSDHMGTMMEQRLRLERRKWLEANRSLARAGPRRTVERQRRRTHELTQAMMRAMAVRVRSERAHLTSLQARLSVLDPLAVLQRGYVVLENAETGATLSRAGDATPGMRLQARLADGTVAVRVENT
jgi:exodeoxyribonuclease VII large subunit